MVCTCASLRHQWGNASLKYFRTSQAINPNAAASLSGSEIPSCQVMPRPLQRLQSSCMDCLGLCVRQHVDVGRDEVEGPSLRCLLIHVACNIGGKDTKTALLQC
eukprot:4350509-Amphidinium_carterae.2